MKKLLIALLASTSCVFAANTSTKSTNQSESAIIQKAFVDNKLMNSKVTPAIEAMVKKRFPQAQFELITYTPIPNVYAGYAGNVQMFISTDTDMIIFGHAFDPHTGQDITQAISNRLQQERKISWKDLPLDNAVVTKASSKPVKKIAILTDPDCPYCRNLEKFLTSYNNVEVYRLLYPLDIHPNAQKDVQSIICSDNPANAVAEIMLNNQMLNTTTNSDCLAKAKKVIDADKDFAQKNGFSGTPVIILEDGSVIYGLDTDRLNKYLTSK